MNESCVLVISAPGLLSPDLMEMVDAGKLPTLRQMMECGAIGFVRQEAGANITQQVWTLATGFPVSTHGVPGPCALMPDGMGIYPIGRRASRCMPFWEVSARQGLGSCSVAWPGTRDSDESNLCVFTDDLTVTLGAAMHSSPVLPGTVTDHEMEAALSDLRVHPSEIPAQELERFVPGAPNPRIQRITAQALAAAATVQAVTLHVVGTRRFRVIAVHFDFLDRLRRLRSSAPHRVSNSAIAQGYRFFDSLLANVRLALSRHGTLILATVAARDRPDHVVPGIVLIEGPNVRPDMLMGDVALTGIAPTALWCAGAAVPQSWLPLPWKSAYREVSPVTACSMELAMPCEESGHAWRQAQQLGFHLRPPLAPYRRQIECLLAETTAGNPPA